MKPLSLLAAVALAATSVSASSAVAADPATQPAAAPSTQPNMNQYQTASYGIGYDLGRNIRESHIALDADLIVQGLRDCLAGTNSKVSQDDFQTAMTKVREELMANAQASQAKAGEAAGKQGEAYRAENAKKPGVKVTASGLQYETVKEGTGDSPKPTDKVKVHYTGTLIDGTKFDSSVDRGQPAEFPLNGVIRGWTEGLQLMKVGGKSRFVIPAELAYGANGAPPTIPPNATLVFDVELLGINGK